MRNFGLGPSNAGGRGAGLDARLLAPELAEMEARLATAEVADTIWWLDACVHEAAALERGAPRSPSEVADWLRRNGGTARARRAAQRGELGLEVVAERIGAALVALDHRERLLLTWLGDRLPRGQEPPVLMIECVLKGRNWRVREAAAQAIGKHLLAGGPPGNSIEAIRHTANAPAEHPWVRDACDAALCAADQQGGIEHLIAGLIPRPDPRHFLLRRRRVVRVAERAPDAARLLRVVLADPSEHVRIGLAEVAARLGAEELVRALGADPADRVRLAAVEYASRVEAPFLVRLVEERVTVEAVPMVVAALARAAERLAASRPADGPRLRSAMDLVIAADRDGAATEAASAARQACTRVSDPDRVMLRDRLLAHVRAIRPGGRALLAWKDLGLAADRVAPLLGSTLAELSRTDHGLSAEIQPRGLVIWRGDRRVFQPWRFLYELRNPAPNKRQAWSHVLGRAPRGAVRAPPGNMAEVTPTMVPGERRLIGTEGSWVPILPMPDDLLHLHTPTEIHSAAGSVVLRPPRGWARRALAWLRLTWGYAWYDALRTRSLQADVATERAAYLRAIEALGFTVVWRLDSPAPRRLTTLAAAAHGSWSFATAAAGFLSPNPISQPALAWFTAALLATVLCTAAVRRERLRTARNAIPLVIGGWGTRGKSGTERLKAGLFHGLGYGAVSKTTGCEAMIVVGRPGTRPREIFLYRPHDKATIWEQASVVEQAAGMGARVLLWECMALRPHLVSILQHDWMRDDLATITNAFPDHEDLQGPSGAEVAEVISEFVPYRSVAITSEQEFLPVMRSRAEERGTELDVVDAVEADLLGEDLLALFPYQEHPRNIALAARMAERLGVPWDTAVALMAENVVPDLGVLRTFPPVMVRGRVLTFINGMSANERAGCMSNWRRTGCDRIDVDVEPTRAVVLIVNNRADRPARSRVFARLVAEELPADAVVVIGTAVDSFVQQATRAMEEALRSFSIYPGQTGDLDRIVALFRKVRVGRPSADALLAKVAAQGGRTVESGPLAARLNERLERPGVGWDVDALIGELAGDDSLRADWERAADPASMAHDAWLHWVEAVAGQILHARARAECVAGSLSDASLRAAVLRLWTRRVRPLTDAKITGDQVIAAVAEMVPPGFSATVMGIQNIKGAGLDLAYRWTAIGEVSELLAAADGTDPRTRVTALQKLATFDDFGWVDSGLAVARVQQVPPDADDEERALRDQVLERVRGIHAERVVMLERRRIGGRFGLGLLEALLDPVDAVFRYFAARRVVRRLRHHTISLGEAAHEMMRLVERQKGGWLG